MLKISKVKCLFGTALFWPFDIYRWMLVTWPFFFQHYLFFCVQLIFEIEILLEFVFSKVSFWTSLKSNSWANRTSMKSRRQIFEAWRRYQQIQSLQPSFFFFFESTLPAQTQIKLVEQHLCDFKSRSWNSISLASEKLLRNLT